MLYLSHIPGFLRMIKRARHVKKHGVHQYAGDAKQICEQIVNDCWNGEFFQTSTGHFCEFWTRDFGMCAEALLRLKYKKEVEATLSYALASFQKAGKVTTNIPKNRKPADFPKLAVDSLPFLLRSLQLLGSRALVQEYQDFLTNEIDRYYAAVFDPKTSLVRQDRSFSSIKDFSKRKSSTYDNSMLAMLREDLTTLGLPNPFSEYDIPAAMEKQLWNGSFFEEDMRKTRIVTGDANTFPFWCGAFGSRKMVNSSLKHIRVHGLDKPLPLKYTDEETMISNMIWIELFSGGYERNTVWMHLGLCYMDVVRKHDKPLFLDYVTALTNVIEREKNFLELFDKNGHPFHTSYYWADEGMLWAAKYLDFVK